MTLALPTWPRAILFDMDGLLVDSEPIWFLAEQDLATSLGARWDHADATSCVGVGLPGTVIQIARKAHVHADVDVLVEALIERFGTRVPEIVPKAGAAALVEAALARGVPIAVATSSPRRIAERVLSSVGLLAHFGAIACGDEVPAPKPDPAVYHLAAERIGVPTEVSLVLEDSPTGAEAGRRAGATVYAVPEGAWRERGFEPWTDAICGSLDEVRTRLGW